MDPKDRLAALVKALPPAQRLGIVVGIAVLAMAAVPFVMWVTTPSYTLLYSGMSDSDLGTVTDELNARGVPYQLEGSRVLVPQARLHEVRAQLAQAGVSATPTIPGYELLDNQPLGASNLRQQVDLLRALEGELARTLSAMDGVESATVRLVIPESQLFTDNQTPPSASVLVRPNGQLGNGQVEAITLLVSSAVEGLETNHITVANTAGTVLHAPGDGTVGGSPDRHQRSTREFERGVAAELTQLVQQATGSTASVVVRAELDYSEVELQEETIDSDSATPMREQVIEERFEGGSAPVGGVVGVDGGPLPNFGGENDGSYERTEATREFVFNRSQRREVQAPGQVQRMSVALVVDEAASVGDEQLQQLVTAAAGLDAERGDVVAISRVAVPAIEVPEEVAPGPALVDLIQQAVALLLLLVIAIGLFLMSRRRKSPDAPEISEKVVPAQLRPSTPQLKPEQSRNEPLPAPGPSIHDEVVDLVERQPEEIAQLLRGWLADRRTVAR